MPINVTKQKPCPPSDSDNAKQSGAPETEADAQPDLEVKQPIDNVDMAQETTHTEDYESCIFVSDRQPGKTIQRLFQSVNQRLLCYERKLFCNRSFEDLRREGCKWLWIDTSDKWARDWLVENVYDPKIRHSWKLMAVHSKGNNQRWIANCSPDQVVSYPLFKEIKAVTLEELCRRLSVLHRAISAPVFGHSLLSCLYPDRLEPENGIPKGGGGGAK